MAAHNYYFNKNNGGGIKWTTENFLKVLENSVGSAFGDNTNELILGDRVLFKAENKLVNSPQSTFDFYDECNEEFDLGKMKDSKFFID